MGAPSVNTFKWSGLAIVFVILVVSTWFRTRGTPITIEEFGEAWPFKAETAILKCDGDAPLIEISGKKYALSELGQAKGYLVLDPVLTNHPTLSGSQELIWPIRDIAKKKCTGR